jgi:hypothetical protein
VHWRLHGPKFLRQTLVEWAAPSIFHAYWARLFDEQPRAQGSAHQAALRALAFTWMRLVSRGWKNRTPYDEAPSLTAVKHRDSPLLRCMWPS